VTKHESEAWLRGIHHPYSTNAPISSQKINPPISQYNVLFKQPPLQGSLRRRNWGMFGSCHFIPINFSQQLASKNFGKKCEEDVR
jgi:hypothetical protein